MSSPREELARETRRCRTGLGSGSPHNPGNSICTPPSTPAPPAVRASQSLPVDSFDSLADYSVGPHGQGNSIGRSSPGRCQIRLGLGSTSASPTAEKCSGFSLVPRARSSTAETELADDDSDDDDLPALVGADDYDSEDDEAASYMPPSPPPSPPTASPLASPSCGCSPFPLVSDVTHQAEESEETSTPPNGTERLCDRLAALDPLVMAAECDDPLELSPAALLGLLIDRWRHLVVHVRKSDYEVYIGRPRVAQGETSSEAPWGLPEPLSEHPTDAERERSLCSHRRALFSDRNRILKARSELAGKVLGCWCEPHGCHGHLLAALANCTPSELARVLPPRVDPEHRRLRDAELATFSFPLTSLEEVRRLLATQYASPTILLGGEFSGAVGGELYAVFDELSLSVDLRTPLNADSIAYVGDMVDVIALKRWQRAFFWPPCVHQTLSDTTSHSAKFRDGRAFWGIALFIRCLCAPADCVMVEQPDTVIPRFYRSPTQRVRPSYFGDASRKPINLYLVGTDPLAPPLDHVGVADSGAFYSFSDADQRDRWRSSWQRHPLLVSAVAWGVRPARWARSSLDYRVEIERFAVEWHRRGLLVPTDYANPTGRPLSEEARLYQFARGDGDGRRILSTIPLSLLEDGDGDVRSPVPCGLASQRHLFREGAPLSKFADMADFGVVLCLVALAVQPLVYASLDGFTVVGAELGDRYLRDSTLRLATSWIAPALAATRSACFLAGEFLDGPRVAVAPYAEPVAEEDVARTPARRRTLLRSGRLFAWCALAALASCPSLEPAARAITAARAFVSPVAMLADSATLGTRSFRFGVQGAQALQPSLLLTSSPTATGQSALQRAWQEGRLLRDALLAEQTADLDLWAERITPVPVEDVLPHLIDNPPDFSVRSLDYVSFASITPPLQTTWLPRSPPQPASDRCPMSAWELMLPSTQTRVSGWLEAALLDLQLIEEDGEDAERRRPPPIAVGQLELHPWARGIVWDFTFERSQCGVPLDYTLPISTHLNLTYLGSRLADHPDQRLVSFLLEGVRLEADVELQSVFVPHLMSLAKGFHAVRKELRRMREKGWYEFFGHMPFWPMYLNGQGSTPRKYEPGRDRRTTEGGGPRKETFDASGLAAWSINAAARAYHLPRHLAEMLTSSSSTVQDWLRAKGLPRTPQQLEEDLLLRSKWPGEQKPTLKVAMRNLSVLRRVAYLLGEPLYIFVDDCADYFSQLAMSPEAWPLLGIAFIRDEEELRSASEIAVGDVQLFFVSERRLGFGTHPASNIAQRFSDALVEMFRQDMDAADAPFLAADQRPSHVAWRQARAKVASRTGTPAFIEQRLYFVIIYTDDPLFAVVGVDRAIRALKIWRRLTTDIGLIMAIPEKRTLGTWGLWLGALLLTTLAVVVIPREKLLRATRSVREALASRLQWCDYRALCGLLEHLRSVNCASRTTLNALYEPHRRNLGPSDLVEPSAAMCEQLEQQLDFISASGGAPFTAALSRAHLPARGGMICVISNDAATDSLPAGIGGFCHGMWWYVAVDPECLRFLHIGVLELLATGIGAIVFAPYLLQFCRVALLSDALATPHTLSGHRPKSSLLRFALKCLLECAEYEEVARVADVYHLFGAGNPASDAVSRNEMERFHQLCRQLGVRPRHIELPPAALAIFERVSNFARLRDVEVRHDLVRRTVEPLPHVPRHATSLGVHNINQDGRPIAHLARASIQAMQYQWLLRLRALQRREQQLRRLRLARTVAAANIQRRAKELSAQREARLRWRSACVVQSFVRGQRVRERLELERADRIWWTQYTAVLVITRHRLAYVQRFTWRERLLRTLAHQRRSSWLARMHRRPWTTSWHDAAPKLQAMCRGFLARREARARASLVAAEFVVVRSRPALVRVRVRLVHGGQIFRVPRHSLRREDPLRTPPSGYLSDDGMPDASRWGRNAYQLEQALYAHRAASSISLAAVNFLLARRRRSLFSLAVPAVPGNAQDPMVEAPTPRPDLVALPDELFGYGVCPCAPTQGSSGAETMSVDIHQALPYGPMPEQEEMKLLAAGIGEIDASNMEGLAVRAVRDPRVDAIVLHRLADPAECLQTATFSPTLRYYELCKAKYARLLPAMGLASVDGDGCAGATSNAGHAHPVEPRSPFGVRRIEGGKVVIIGKPEAMVESLSNQCACCKLTATQLGQRVLQVCSRCRRTQYCSTQCFKLHWGAPESSYGHRHQCTEICRGAAVSVTFVSDASDHGDRWVVGVPAELLWLILHSERTNARLSSGKCMAVRLYVRGLTLKRATRNALELVEGSCLLRGVEAPFATAATCHEGVHTRPALQDLAPSLQDLAARPPELYGNGHCPSAPTQGSSASERDPDGAELSPSYSPTDSPASLHSTTYTPPSSWGEPREGCESPQYSPHPDHVTAWDRLYPIEPPPGAAASSLLGYYQTRLEGDDCARRAFACPPQKKAELGLYISWHHLRETEFERRAARQERRPHAVGGMPEAKVSVLGYDCDRDGLMAPHVFHSPNYSDPPLLSSTCMLLVSKSFAALEPFRSRRVESARRRWSEGQESIRFAEWLAVRIDISLAEADWLLRGPLGRAIFDSFRLNSHCKYQELEAPGFTVSRDELRAMTYLSCGDGSAALYVVSGVVRAVVRYLRSSVPAVVSKHDYRLALRLLAGGWRGLAPLVEAMYFLYWGSPLATGYGPRWGVWSTNAPWRRLCPYTERARLAFNDFPARRVELQLLPITAGLADCPAGGGIFVDWSAVLRAAGPSAVAAHPVTSMARLHSQADVASLVVDALCRNASSGLPEEVKRGEYLDVRSLMRTCRSWRLRCVATLSAIKHTLPHLQRTRYEYRENLGHHVPVREPVASAEACRQWIAGAWAETRIRDLRHAHSPDNYFHAYVVPPQATPSACGPSAAVACRPALPAVTRTVPCSWRLYASEDLDFSSTSTRTSTSARVWSWRKGVYKRHRLRSTLGRAQSRTLFTRRLAAHTRRQLEQQSRFAQSSRPVPAAAPPRRPVSAGPPPHVRERPRSRVPHRVSVDLRRRATADARRRVSQDGERVHPHPGFIWWAQLPPELLYKVVLCACEGADAANALCLMAVCAHWRRLGLFAITTDHIRYQAASYDRRAARLTARYYPSDNAVKAWVSDGRATVLERETRAGMVHLLQSVAAGLRQADGDPRLVAYHWFHAQLRAQTPRSVPCRTWTVRLVDERLLRTDLIYVAEAATIINGDLNSARLTPRRFSTDFAALARRPQTEPLVGLATVVQLFDRMLGESRVDRHAQCGVPICSRLLRLTLLGSAIGPPPHGTGFIRLYTDAAVQRAEALRQWRIFLGHSPYFEEIATTVFPYRGYDMFGHCEDKCLFITMMYSTHFEPATAITALLLMFYVRVYFRLVDSVQRRYDLHSVLRFPLHVINDRRRLGLLAPSPAQFSREVPSLLAWGPFWYVERAYVDACRIQSPYHLLTDYVRDNNYCAFDEARRMALEGEAHLRSLLAGHHARYAHNLERRQRRVVKAAARRAAAALGSYTWDALFATAERDTHA